MPKKPAVPPNGLPPALLASPSFQLERVRRRIRDGVETVLDRHGTTLRGYWVLTCITAGDAASQTALSQLLHVDTSDMVRLIDGLEEQGWAKRARDPKDRRRQIVAVTKKGAKAQAELARLVADAEAAALDQATEKQRRHLRKLTHAVLSTDHAEDVDPAPDDRPRKDA